MAHALDGYDGKCKNIHGHSYKLMVTVKGKPEDDVKSVKNGMVIDFSDLNKIVEKHICDRFDHALVLKDDSEVNSGLRGNTKIVEVPYQPTCENLLIDFKNRIKEKFPSDTALFSMKLEETAKSYCEWFLEDNSNFGH